MIKEGPPTGDQQDLRATQATGKFNTSLRRQQPTATGEREGPTRATGD